MEYRNEYKFICSAGELEILRGRLAPLMERDAHQKGESYRVRSLYFDDYADSAFYDNAAGVDRRRKFRIRVYDDLKMPVRLEIKDKYRDKTRKFSCSISEDTCLDLMAGRLTSPKEDTPYPLVAFYLAASECMLRPRIIIEYARTAFVHKAGNTRITFDQGITRSEDVGRFFSEDITRLSILPEGQHIVEVKYDEFLPDWIAQALELGELRRATFSKYYLGRICKKGGIEL